MKKILIYYLLITLSIIINSCSDSFKEEYSSKVSIVLAEVTAVPSLTKDTTPDYTFSSTIDGVISYVGSCSSSTTAATYGNNTITLDSLNEGTYSDCTITITNQKLNLNSSLTITSFTVDTTAPTIEEVTAVTTPTSDITPDYTFSSTEAGTITYGGYCSSSTTSAISGNNTITLVSLSERTYSNCTITVTDSAGNISNSLTITSFIVDATAATLVEVTAVTNPTYDTTPDYTFSSSEAGTITYGGSCSSSTTSATTDNNTITLDPLSGGTYSDCTITVTDTAGNAVTKNMSSFSVLEQMGGSRQGVELSLTTEVTTLAGSFPRLEPDTTDHDNGTLASFDQPWDITTDGTNLYVVDTSNHTIRQVVISTGAVTTLAGTAEDRGNTDNTTGTAASFKWPKGITTDGTNIYVADSSNHLIRQIVISTGAVTTLAGGGSGTSTDDTGTAASFSIPQGITTDGTNLYVADSSNHKIRKIVIDNATVTTLAGTGSPGSTDNTTGTSASFNEPLGITTDGTNLYVADTKNHLIRQIVISTRAVTTLAGTGSSGTTDNTTGTSASFYGPSGITTDGFNLYVADRSSSLIRRIVIATGAVTTLAGMGSGNPIDGTGTEARFRVPTGITSDGIDLYVLDKQNHLIRKIE
jgi:hypothetical protein